MFKAPHCGALLLYYEFHAHSKVIFGFFQSYTVIKHCLTQPINYEKCCLNDPPRYHSLLDNKLRRRVKQL